MSNKILLLFYFYFLSASAFAFPLTTYFGETPDAQFVKLYYERLDTFYRQELPTSNAALTKDELNYISECKKSWTKIGVSEHPLHLFEFFSFRYKIQSGGAPLSYFFIGTDNKTKTLLQLIDTISKSRGMPLTKEEKETFFGFAWSNNGNTFSTTHLINSLESLPPKSPLRQTFLDHQQDNWWSTRLYVKTKDKNGIIQTSLHIPLKNRNLETLPRVPLDIVSATKIISDTKGISWHYRLKSLPPFLIKDSIHPLIERYNQNFNLYPHSIIYQDINNFTLYYP